MTSVEELFDRLGRSVEAAWAAKRYDPREFAGIAARALQSDPPFASVGLAQVIEWAFRHGSRVPQIGQQRDAFGQPPFTVYRAHKFYIEVITWVDGSTSIHEHGFQGAFTPICGKSVHSRWRFSEAGRQTSELRWGEVALLSTEILRVGDVREIHGGAAGAHQLFHLDRPSATVVVRTYGDPTHRPQLSYFPPGLAFADADDVDPYWARISKYLGALRVTEDRSYARYVRQVLLGDDLGHAFRYLRHLGSVGSAAELELVASLASEARERHGPIADAIWRSQPFIRRSTMILHRRQRVVDDGQRFFLAVLMLMTDRNDIAECVRAWTGTTEVEAPILAWLEQLSGASLLGVDFDATNLSIARALLRVDTLADFLASLEAEYGDSEVAGKRAALIAHARALAGAPLLEPLFGRADWLRAEAS